MQIKKKIAPPAVIAHTPTCVDLETTVAPLQELCQLNPQHWEEQFQPISDARHDLISYAYSRAYDAYGILP